MRRSILPLLVLTLAAGCAVSPTPPEGEPRPAGASEARSPREAVKAAAVVVDVRTPDEFASGHVEGAVNIPVDEIAQRTDEIATLLGGDRSKKVAVYCAAGRRAERAKGTLEKAAFTDVVNAGGYSSLR